MFSCCRYEKKREVVRDALVVDGSLFVCLFEKYFWGWKMVVDTNQDSVVT